MKIVLTGACGFAGSTIAGALLGARDGLEIVGLDNLSRPGSELNRTKLAKLGIKLLHLDIRNQSDVDALDRADWVIDAAANPSVLGGVDGRTSSRQIIEHNLLGTINLLEYCKRHRAGFILLSTSRVYSVSALTAIKVAVVDDGYRPCRKGFAVLIRKEFQKIFRPTRQFRCTARPSAPRNSSRLSMAVVSIFRCGSIAAVSWPVRTNLGKLIREFFHFGSTVISAANH